MTQRFHSWGIYTPTKPKITNLKRKMYSKVYSSITYNRQSMESAQESTNRKMDKEDVVNIHSGILLDHKKE